MILTPAIVILDFKGNINSEKLDSRLRHSVYAKKLMEFSNIKPIQLVVLSRGKSFRKDSANNIDFYQIKSSKMNLIGFLFKSLYLVKKQKLKVCVIVCGDPWESFIAGKIFSKIVHDNSKLQVQVHADISDLNWRRISTRNLARSVLHKYTFHHCDQVRVVSNKIANYVRSINPNQQIVVVPIPINIQNRIERSFNKQKDMIKIGFFGRLHKDRGTENFIELMRKLNSFRNDFCVYIAGYGPEQPRLKSELEMLLGSKRVFFLGQLEQSDIWRHLSKLDVYFSLAPSESYGLGLRESVIAGVPVIASESNGSFDARQIFGDDWIKIVTVSISPQSLSELIDAALEEIPNDDALTIQTTLNSSQIDTLIKSWLLLVESASI